MGDTKIITIDPVAGLRDVPGSTAYVTKTGEMPYIKVYVGEEYHPLRTEIDTLMLPVPNTNYARGDITHKPFAEMNRKERRAFLSNKKRCVP